MRSILWELCGTAISHMYTRLIHNSDRRPRFSACQLQHHSTAAFKIKSVKVVFDEHICFVLALTARPITKAERVFEQLSCYTSRGGFQFEFCSPTASHSNQPALTDKYFVALFHSAPHDVIKLRAALPGAPVCAYFVCNS